MLNVLLEAALRSLVLAACAGVVLAALRVKNPVARLTVWSAVLCGALAMPLLILGSRALGTWQILPVWFALDSVMELTATTANADQPQAAVRFADLREFALGLYATIAVLLLARLGVGLARGWALIRRLRPADVTVIGGDTVCLSGDVNAPMVFGSVILLPRASTQWSADKQAVVLAHEASHLARGDFYIQVLAGLHRAVFWFNPLAWWLPHKLAALAEMSSDDAAARVAGDRAAYAEILVDVARAAQPVAAAISMARGPAVPQRVARLLSGVDLSMALSGRQRAAIVLALMPVILLSAGSIARTPGAQAIIASVHNGIMPPRSNPRRPVTQPEYPAESKRRGEQGAVLLMLTVDAAGRVTDAKLDKSSGFARLDDAAMKEAIRTWHLLPGTVDGKPAPMRHKFQVTFRISPASTPARKAAVMNIDLVVAPRHDPAHGPFQPAVPNGTTARMVAGLVTVERDGSVSKVVVDESSGQMEVDEAFRSAFARARFLPGTVNGEPRAMTLPVRLALNAAN